MCGSCIGILLEHWLHDIIISLPNPFSGGGIIERTGKTKEIKIRCVSMRLHLIMAFMLTIFSPAINRSIVQMLRGR